MSYVEEGKGEKEAVMFACNYWNYGSKGLPKTEIQSQLSDL